MKKFLEKTLEDIIWNSNPKLLSERGLSIPPFKKRQLKIGGYGVADIVSIQRIHQFVHHEGKEYVHPDSYFEITVYELKKDLIDVNSFLQAVRYCKGISKYIERRNEGKKYKHRIFYNMKIVLVGSQIDKGPFIFLPDLIETYEQGIGKIGSLEFYTYDYDLDGIIFNEHKQYSYLNEFQ